MTLRKLFILILSLCIVTLVGCGSSGSSDSNLDIYQVFSDNLLQRAEDTTNLNDLKDATIYFTSKLPSSDKTSKEWDEESKFSFKPSKSFSDDSNETEDEETTKATHSYSDEEGTLYFGNHAINSSSREYLLELFEIENLADLDGLIYQINGQGYKADNGQLYLTITDFNVKQ